MVTLSSFTDTAVVVLGMRWNVKKKELAMGLGKN